jgi:hypothetical protein
LRQPWKKGNCQVGVFLAYFKKKRRTLIDERLYLPQQGLILFPVQLRDGNLSMLEKRKEDTK